MPGTCETTLQWYNYIFISVKVCAVQMRIQQIILIVDLCFFQTDIPTLSTEWVELLTLHTGSVWGFQSVLPVSHSALCSSLGTGQSEIGCSQYVELCTCVQVPAACNVCSCSIFYLISPTWTNKVLLVRHMGFVEDFFSGQCVQIKILRKAVLLLIM